MHTSPSRVSAYSDVRQLSTSAHKAGFMVTEYALAKKATARHFGLKPGVVSRATAALLEGRPIGKTGRPSALSPKQDAQLKAEVEKLVKEHRPPSRRQLAALANDILRKDVLQRASQDPTATLYEVESSIPKVTPSWARQWLKKHPDLAEYTPRYVEPQRSEGCRDSIIEAWFETWKKEVETEPICPSMLANFDETMIQPQAMSKVKVVGFRDAGGAVKCSEPELPHITLGVTIFADGTSIDHLIIYPCKFVPQEVRGDRASDWVGYSFAGQESGWINKDLFAEHCRQTIIPAFEHRRAKLEKLGIPNAVGIFLVDGHSSRLNSQLIEEFNQHNIKIPVLPSHASHVLQPLDLAVFGAFKSALSSGDSYVRDAPLPERRAAIMAKARTALHMSLCASVINTSWKRSGLHPFNPTIPLQHPCTRLSEEDQPLKIDPSGKGKGSRYNMSGKVITNFTELEAIRLVEERQASKAQAKYSKGQVPKDKLVLTDPEKCLPPQPKRRGRPRKSVAPAVVCDPSVEAQ